MAAVGFDLYLKMIEEAARELKGEEAVPRAEPELLLPVSAYIPEEYISEPHQRLSVYKRIASFQDEADLELIREELDDRYGPLPEPVLRLLQVMRIKLLCRQKWVERLEAGGGRLRVRVDSSAQIEGHKIEELLAAFQDRIRFLSSHSFELRQTNGDWDKVSKEIENCLKAL
ncbi:MAG TPA: TRCF domain-containing protein [Nitrospiria bacterium]|nr:TRCF domain-containing protein [Nitrospiria bacterium]